MNSEQAPESLIKSWLGHSAKSSVTDLYDRSQADTKYRKQVAEQVGIGFESNFPLLSLWFSSPNWFPVLSLGTSLQQQSFYFILAQNLNQSFSKKERN